MILDVIQPSKHGRVTKKMPYANTSTHRNTFMHVKCLISESNLGHPQHLSWNSLWRKLMTESN